MEYLPQVRVSKEDFLALSDLAGDMSIMDYMSKVIRDHIHRPTQDAQDGARVCPECDGAVEFCAMGHYVPANNAPPVI